MGAQPSRGDRSNNYNGWGNAPAQSSGQTTVARGVPVSSSHLGSVSGAGSSGALQDGRRSNIFEETYRGDVAALRARLCLDHSRRGEDVKQASWTLVNTRRGQDGTTALHVAAAKGLVDVMRTLIEAGAEVELQDKTGWRPLHFAAAAGKRAAVEALLSKGASKEVFTCDPSSDKPPQTPFDLCTTPDLKTLLWYPGVERAHARELSPSSKKAVVITKVAVNVAVFGALALFVSSQLLQGGNNARGKKNKNKK
mmetsp:Transcript_9442/g.10938  ORF Transcript_9442/g.10938 Transcript_9442/m.10938 type:complete len:253 (+) Transcript_9442:84-842(+)|eukprot:CAMPEP_0197854744 /NCGR_PEP_ID=MMETSP1438-20131217/25254_1 /TAXON_ID=1461541 /ORGANISM="Pterosperma sp., Strain CCMP1384" /LENGTH=252 /DNA_ID=CAMNT_0043469599 /DNA_START=74 /DNA_END=832 /DNA_ORIENTATION=-